MEDRRYLSLRSCPKKEATGKILPVESAGSEVCRPISYRTTRARQSGITAAQREWINFAENELGRLELLPEVIPHWKLTCAKLNQTDAESAVAEFLAQAKRDYPNHRTLNNKRTVGQVSGGVFNRAPARSQSDRN